MAVRRVVETGLIEPAPAPEHFRLTDAGRRFVANVRRKIEKDGKIGWGRVNEVDFPTL
jgi:hypothetical protein